MQDSVATTKHGKLELCNEKLYKTFKGHLSGNNVVLVNNK